MQKNNQKIPEGWSVKKLGDIATKISRKNTVQNTNVVTISAQKGFINQEQFFNKSVAGENLSTYYLLERGDFGYNRSYSKGYPTGAIKRLDNYDYAIASTLYICFTLKDKVDSNYVLQYFEAGLQNIELYKIVQEGARNHGLLNIAISDFFNIKLVLPPLAEQEKIADILGTWDEAIEKLSNLIEQKKLLKKGLMQKLLTGKTRLPTFTQPWKEVKLGEIADLYQPQTISQEMLVDSGYPVYGANGFIGYFSECNHKTWQIMVTCRGSTCGTVNRTKGPSWITGNAMVINCDNHDICKTFLYYKLLTERFSSVISGSGQPQIVRSPLLKWKICVPSDISEQQAIADVLSTADDEINLLDQKLEALKTQKKGLMQRLLTGQIRVKVN